MLQCRSIKDFLFYLKQLIILFRSDYFFFRKYLRQKHSHGCHKILFTARLLLFRLGERYSVVTARHEERYLPASTSPLSPPSQPHPVLMKQYVTLYNATAALTSIFMTRIFILVRKESGEGKSKNRNLY